MEKQIKYGGMALVMALASTLVTGCGSSQTTSVPPVYNPGGYVPGQVPGKVPDLPPISQLPTPGKDPGQLPGQLPQVPGQIPQIPGQFPGQFPGQVPPTPGKFDPTQAGTLPGQIPFAPGATPAGQPGILGQPGTGGLPAIPGVATAPGLTGTNFQPAQPGTAGPSAPGTSIPGVTAPGSVAASPTTSGARFTNEQLTQLQTSIKGVKGGDFEGQMALIVGYQQYTASQKYQALSQLAMQVAARVQGDGSQNIAQLQAYVRQFAPDQGEAVAKVVAEVNALSEQQIKTELRATHMKITAEMQKLLEEVLQPAAAAPTTTLPAATAPVANPAVTAPPQTTGMQGAPAPMFYWPTRTFPTSEVGRVSMINIRMGR